MTTPDIPTIDLVMLWYCDFHDHPLTGVALYKGKPVWWSIIDDDGWDDLSTIPEGYSLSSYEKDSMDTIEGSWCKDSLYNLYELDETQYQFLAQQQMAMLAKYPNSRTDRRSKEELALFQASEISKPECKMGKFIRQVRWWQIERWFEKDV